jgi:hypothetical protein
MFVVTSHVQNFLLLFVLSTFAAGQVDSPANPYLLRLEHGNYETHVCVLLQNGGAFHLEADRGDTTRIFEGTLPIDQLHEVKHILENNSLANLSQRQIEEPLIRTHSDTLQINIFRKDQWQDLMFHSRESQEPYYRLLEPLVRWLDNIHKLPHKELSEDEGKNNCLPPREIVLKKRSDERAAESTKPSVSPAVASQPASQMSKPEHAPTLLRVYSFSMKSGSAHQTCLQVNANGKYRFETRMQKTGSKTVKTQVAGGQIGPDEVLQLQQLLEDPTLAKIRHRVTSRMVLPMSGEMLNLQISRPSGVQDLILSSTFDKPGIPFFYSGDGDISRAQELMKFLAQHVEDKSGVLDPNQRNDCQEAP